MCGLVSPEGECTAAGGRSFLTSLALLRALPWRKFKKGSTLVIEVRVHVATCCAPVFMHWNLPPLLWCAAQSIIPCIRQHLPPLSMQLGGAINDQKGGRFSPPTNIPTLCEALQKAALDPRIEGVYFKVTGRASLIARTGRLCEVGYNSAGLRAACLPPQTPAATLACLQCERAGQSFWVVTEKLWMVSESRKSS